MYFTKTYAEAGEISRVIVMSEIDMTGEMMVYGETQRDKRIMTLWVEELVIPASAAYGHDRILSQLAQSFGMPMRSSS